jgi:general secretion pathway protein F
MNIPLTFSPMLADSSLLPSADLVVFEILEGLGRLIAFFILIGVSLGTLFLIHFLFTLPMRRAERARLFLDLLEDAIKRGQPVEEMILSIAQSRDQIVGVRFYLLAAHLENGLRFGEALKKVQSILPPQISAMLLAGETFGDLKKVLPACREILRDRPAGVRSAVHYMLLVVLLFSPMFVGVVTLIMTFVVPKFREVAAGMGSKLWPETIFVFASANWLMNFELFIFSLLVAASVVYVGGPGFVRWFRFHGFPIVDWIAWHIPWKRKKLLRAFSAMLAVLLDGGVPEAEAVRLAGECTANEICRHRAQRVIAALQQGAKLDEAVRLFDDSGEFHWRLTNATRARGGFLDALRGWHAALDAKAFQQEEATAHVVTSGLVILNGALVALIATAMFGIIINLLNAMLSSM